MSLTIQQYDAIRKLHPQTDIIRGDEAFDSEGNKIAYDINAVNAEVEQAQQAQETHKQNAIAKLTALGLTADEISALGV